MNTRRVLGLVLVCCLLLPAYLQALDSKILSMRNTLFEGSKEIKALIPNSRDAVLLTTLFDSCIIAVSQLDAYFSMLGIFEAIKKDDLTVSSVDFIVNWLNQIKKTNDINIGVLSNLPTPVEQATMQQADKAKGYFQELNRWVDAELVKLNILRKSIKGGAPAAQKQKR